MNKSIKILTYCLISLTVVFIPILFLLKFDNYKPCQAISDNKDKYLVLTKDVYDELEDYKQIKLLQDKKTFKVKVENDWTNTEGIYIARIKSSYIFKNDDLKIFVNSTNIFKF